MGKLGTRMRRARLGSGGHSTASSSPDDRRDRSALFPADWLPVWLDTTTE
jgi:hypothetical protein